LADLSYKALPYLDKDLESLDKIGKKQIELFPFEEQFMSTENYYNAIQQKKDSFLIYWDKKNLRSWNFAEMYAYKKLNITSK
jgi:hypothetical protein